MILIWYNGTETKHIKTLNQNTLKACIRLLSYKDTFNLENFALCKHLQYLLKASWKFTAIFTNLCEELLVLSELSLLNLFGDQNGYGTIYVRSFRSMRIIDYIPPSWTVNVEP